MGTDIFTHKSGLINMCIKHRHIAKGLGLSIFMCVQSYSAIGGVPPPIRENCTVLLLFKNTQMAQIQKIYEEIGGGNEDLQWEQFMEMFNYATAEPYGFLMIDFAPKDPTKRFRKNFNEYLTLESSV